MPTPAVITPRRDRSPDKLTSIGVSGCVLALVVGALAATHYGLLVGGALLGLAFLGIAVITYTRDPIQALMGLWLFEVFNAPLSAVFGYNSTTGQAVRQGDEVLVLLFAFLTIWRGSRTNVRMPPLRFILPGVGVALVGLLGAIIHGVPLTVTTIGTLLGLKLWIMVVITLLLPWQAKDLARIYTTMMVVGVVVAALGLVDYLSHGAVSTALHTRTTAVQEGGYRSESVRSIFPGPGEYSLFMSLLFGLTFARLSNKYSKRDLALALLFASSVMLSLRLKGVLSLVAVVMIVGIVQGAASGRGALIAVLVGSLMVVAVYSVEGSIIVKQFSTYTSSETTARSRLYGVGDRIADDNFPFGAGFGRFASYPSRLYYSPIYYQYELNRVYGLSPTYPDFIDDASWPSVIGETGYAGFAFYVIGLIMLILAGIRRLRTLPSEVRWVPLATLCMIAVFLVDSLGGATLFAWLATTMLAMIFGPMLIATQTASESVVMGSAQS
jgi:hypothetical protein